MQAIATTCGGYCSATNVLWLRESSTWGVREEEKTHLSMVRRHANFVNFFDASSFSMRPTFAFCSKNGESTFELPSDFDHVREWHAGSKIEADEFDNQTLDGQQPLSVLFDDLFLRVL
jgi:hypothetical protein